VFEKNNNDMIYNWRNELKANQNGAFLVAENIASELKTAGHSKSDVIELLAAQDFDLELTNRVASKLFDNVTSAPKPTVHVAVVPTKYADCAPIIEKSLERLSAREFTKRLCSGPYAIVKIDDRQFDSWQRLAELAKTNSSARTSLHAELKPWVEEALLNSVLVAEKNKGQVIVADNNNKVYKVAMKNTEATVDLANGTSTSDKYVKGNYSTFGIADEYMVAAAGKVSPYERLKRALDF
jgi:hypothetical protein